jgi:putative membrane protein
VKSVALLLALGGLALAVWLVVTFDTSAVFAAFAAVGWGLALMVLVRLAILLTCAAAWRTLLRRMDIPGFDVFFVVRFVREAINVMLPVGTVGGDIVGARLITFWKVAGGVAGASIMVDLLLQATGQAMFAALGAMLLARIQGAEKIVEFILGGLGIAALGLGGFVLVQRTGAVHLMERGIAAIVARMRKREDSGQLIGLQAGLSAIWGDLGAVGRSLLLHVTAWLIGVAEIWVALRFMGAGTGWAEAAIVESLGQALRGAAFPVPGTIGVQEGGFVVLGALLGIPPDAAIALSFAKRVPDVVLGLPGLVWWQRIERRAGQQRLVATATGN